LLNKKKSWLTKIGDGAAWFSANRIVLLIAIVCVLIYVLIIDLFRLQIISSADFVLPVTRVENRVRRVALDAPRGNIYDRHGRPLAVNIEVDVIRIDPAVISRPSNELLISIIEFVRLAGIMGDEVVAPSTIQISPEAPYEFTPRTDAARRRWLLDMSVIDNPSEGRYVWLATGDNIEIEDITAEMVMERLLDYFNIPDELPPGVCGRVVLEISAAVYRERYDFNQITVARDVSRHLAVAVEERGIDMPNFYVDVEFLRYYPMGQYMAHIIGYIRPIQINESDMENFGFHPVYRPNGYLPTDMMGVRGLERAFQQSGYLSGTRGVRKVEIDPQGRRVSNRVYEPAIPGYDMFLTIDAQLQQTTVRSIERVLTEMMIARILAPPTTNPNQEPPKRPQEVISGLLRTNNISIISIMGAESGFERSVRSMVESAQLYPGNELESNEQIRNYLISAVNANRVSVNTMLGVLVEQGVITATPIEWQRLTANTLAVPQFLAERVTAGELTVQMVMPVAHSASAVMKCVHTGAVLAAGNYPNFDNNRFVNAFDNAYFNMLNTDPTSPMFNRAFQTNRPPGSTFKMLTAIAGLESRTITPATLIYDGVVFTRAGYPPIRCWTATIIGQHAQGHGNINIAQAIAVSCNYFFYEMSLGLGSTVHERITVLNDFMSRFGLASPPGVEIGGAPNRLSSPENRDGPWTDNLTALTAIGQADNNISTLVMARYMATLVNGGYRFQSHLLHHTVNSAGSISTFEPVLEEVVGISQQNLNAVFNGMHQVFYGTNGTARGFFDGFPIVVGGKTGTAQNGTAHSDVTFTVFAPFDNPQVVIYVMIPFGDTNHYSRPSEQIAKDMLACFFQINTGTEETD